MKKYELVAGTGGLYRIKALKSFGNVKAGDLGGYVASEKNLSHDGNSLVYDNARVYGNAQVYGRAQVHGNAEVYGRARVGGGEIYGNAKVAGDALVIDDNAKIYGRARVFGNEEVGGKEVRNARTNGTTARNSTICNADYDIPLKKIKADLVKRVANSRNPIVQNAIKMARNSRFLGSWGTSGGSGPVRPIEFSSEAEAIQYLKKIVKGNLTKGQKGWWKVWPEGEDPAYLDYHGKLKQGEVMNS